VSDDSGVDLDVDVDVDAESESGNRIPAATASDVLAYIVKSLVDEPDAVQVDVVERRRGPLLEVRVAPGELGRVIGRKGRTAQSIRTVVRAAGTRDGITVDVDFVD
jgi:predicted RNA-binding protein YlqC (UPF0109 family)